MRKSKLNHPPAPAGKLVVIGGHENKNGRPETEMQKEGNDPLEVLESVMLLSGKSSPVIEVITTASGEPEESFNDYLKIFNRLGAADVGQIFHQDRGEVLYDDLTERIGRADVLFFTGGDQLKLTSIYGGTKLLSQIKERYIKEPIVIAGTSAGAMAFSTPMIISGNKDNQQRVGAVRITTGFSLLKNICIDTHFVDRSRFVRMSQVIATNPGCIGIGIEEDTALVVEHGKSIRVIGSGVVIIIDGFHTKSSNVTEFDSGQCISISDLNVSILKDGSVWEIPALEPFFI
ncbi:cyanophycinase [Pedobacter terrae]|uniref:Cyanophycinase n=1 Tax=Pedobacter terrae TaxID=405671 RepID=A0A1G8B087_9SPHI|nr:cyanophycinase [Pedobacter terrae]SDH26607.1 cyanophycinase [Pedobacter terrae]